MNNDSKAVVNSVEKTSSIEKTSVEKTLSCEKTPSVVTSSAVKRANRFLYDAVAGDYESIDGRRDARLCAWIRERLVELASTHGGGVLLDLGSGSGVVAREASGIFDRVIAVDLSPRILAASSLGDCSLAAGDVDAIPLADGSVNVVVCFAVLHHLYSAEHLVGEVSRVLVGGGGFWSDHDMNAAFRNRFRWPLAVYRRLRGADRKYVDSDCGVSRETYDLAEYREDGVDDLVLMGQLRSARLEPRASYHWFGLTSLTNCLFGGRTHGRGWAPLLSIVATKPRERS
jgi:ubiquinone/menaquinone biosynthesis C-methylase UbiE